MPGPVSPAPVQIVKCPLSVMASCYVRVSNVSHELQQLNGCV